MKVFAKLLVTFNQSKSRDSERKLKKLLSEFLINFPARFFPARIYLPMVVIYSWIFRLFGSKSALKKINFSLEKNEVKLTFFDGANWRIVNPIRANRYMRGIDYAGERLLIRYGIGTLNHLPSTFVDVGANVGELSYWFAKRGVSVQCFEPDPQIFSLLKSNLENFANISFFNVALSDFNGKARFAVQSESADSSLVFHGNGLDVIEVEVFRYENHPAAKLLELPAILKMDTEGNEPETLAGFGEFLSSFGLVAVDAGIERLGNDTKKAAISVIENSGLRVFSKENSYMVIGRQE